MEPKIIFSTDNHSLHTKLYCFPVLTSATFDSNSFFCLKCAIRLLQSPYTLNLDKCFLGTEITEHIKKPTISNMNFMLGKSQDLAASLLTAFLDNSEAQVDALTEIKLEGSVQLLSSVQNKGKTWVALDAILSKALKSNQATKAFTLRVLAKLIENNSAMGEYFSVKNNGSSHLNTFWTCAVSVNNEEIQQWALLLLVKLADNGIPTASKCVLSSFSTPLLQMLHLSSNKIIQRNGIELMRGLLAGENNYHIVEIMMDIQIKDVTLPLVIKRYLISSDKQMVIAAAQCVLNILNLKNVNYAKVLLDNKIGSILLEVFYTTDEMLTELPHKAAIFKSTKKIMHVLHILKRGIENPLKTIALSAIIAFSYLLRRNRLFSPVPYTSIEDNLKCMSSVLGYLDDEINSNGIRTRIQQTYKSDFILELYLNIYRAILNLHDSSSQDPPVSGTSFEMSEVQFAMSHDELYLMSSQEMLNSQRLLNTSQRNVLVNSNSQSSQQQNSQQQSNQSSQSSQKRIVQDSNLEHLRDFVLQELEQTMYPMLQAKPECFRNPSIAIAYFDCLRHFFSSDRNEQIVETFAINLISKGFLYQLFQISSYFSSNSQLQTDGDKEIFIKRNLLLNLIFTKVIKEHSLISKLDAGFQHLRGTPATFTCTLTESLNDDVTLCILSLEYYSVIYKQSFSTSKDLFPALLRFITNQSNFQIWELRCLLYLMANCHFNLELNVKTGQLDSNYHDGVKILMDHIQQFNDYVAIYTPSQMFISWIFSINYLPEVVASNTLKYCLSDNLFQNTEERNGSIFQMLNDINVATTFLNCLCSAFCDTELKTKCSHILSLVLDKQELSSPFVSILIQRVPFFISIQLIQQELNENLVVIFLKFISATMSTQQHLMETEEDNQIFEQAIFHHLIKLVPLAWGLSSIAVLQQTLNCLSLFLSKFHVEIKLEAIDVLLCNCPIMETINQVLLSSIFESNVELQSAIFIILAIAVKYKTFQQLQITISSENPVLHRALFSPDSLLVLSTIQILKELLKLNKFNDGQSRLISQLTIVHCSLINLLVNKSKDNDYVDEIFAYLVCMIQTYPKVGTSLALHKWTTTSIQFILKNDVDLTPNFVTFCHQMKQMSQIRERNPDWDEIFHDVLK
ncbi:hypothetical protein CHUAL_013194 [Chamberlinius hualienensis]